MSAVGKSGPFWIDTLASLKGLGTSDALQAGDPGFDTTNKRTLYCISVDGASSSTWGYKRTRVIKGAYSTGSALERWPFLGDGSGVGTAVTDVRVSITMPYAGKMLGFWYHPENDCGNVTVKTYKNKGAAVDTLGPTAVNATQVKFNAATTWAAGDSIAIGITNTNVPTSPMWSLELEEVVTV